MLDIKFIRENKDIVAAGAKKKHIDLDLDKLLALDDKRKELQASIDEKRAEQNVASDAITKASPEERAALIARMQGVKETMKLAEESMQEVLKEWRMLMVQVPNVPDISVPEGDSDADNKEVRRWPDPSVVEGGGLPKFDFEPKNHSELLLTHDMADYERGAKVAGFR